MGKKEPDEKQSRAQQSKARNVRTRHTGAVPKPAPPVPTEEQPRVLSFALSARDRAAVLAVLRGYSSDRSTALLGALGLGDGSPRGGSARDR